MASIYYVFDPIFLQLTAIRQALTGYADAPRALTYNLDTKHGAYPFSDEFFNSVGLIDPLSGNPIPANTCFIVHDGERIEQDLGSLYVLVYDASGRTGIDLRGANQNVQWTMGVRAYRTVGRDPSEIPIVATKVLMNLGIQIRNIVNYCNWMAATPAGCFAIFQPQPPMMTHFGRVRREYGGPSELEFSITLEFLMKTYEPYENYDGNPASMAMTGAY